MVVPSIELPVPLCLSVCVCVCPLVCLYSVAYHVSKSGFSVPSFVTQHSPRHCYVTCITNAWHAGSVHVQNRHCLLDASPDAVDQLRCAHIYPIVVFVKHKSAKQIR